MVQTIHTTHEALAKQIAALKKEGHTITANIGTAYAVVYINGIRAKIIVFVD